MSKPKAAPKGDYTPVSTTPPPGYTGNKAKYERNANMQNFVNQGTQRFIDKGGPWSGVAQIAQDSFANKFHKDGVPLMSAPKTPPNQLPPQMISNSSRPMLGQDQRIALAQQAAQQKQAEEARAAQQAAVKTIAPKVIGRFMKR